MVEDGHYPELEKLMTRIISQQKTYQQEYERHRQKAKKAQGGPGDRLCHAGRSAIPSDARVTGGDVAVVSKKKDEEEDEEDDVDLNDGLLVPPEVPVLTLDDIRKEARSASRRQVEARGVAESVLSACVPCLTGGGASQACRGLMTTTMRKSRKSGEGRARRTTSRASSSVVT